MSRLELKVAPDVVWLLVAALMWLVSTVTPGLNIAAPAGVAVSVLAILAGAALIVTARLALDRSNTTWHPSEPHRTTRLVTDGPFRFSRNPTYLGLLLVLVGWSALLRSPGALATAMSFALYIQRFQTRPEERVLSALLGDEYRDYAARVRRWL